MSASVIVSNTFAAQAGPIPLSQLDANFTQLATAVNSTLNFTNYAVDTGAANAYSVTFSSPATVAYSAGLTISFKAANANSGASTLNVNSLGTKSIVTPAGAAISAGAIAAGQVATVVYDGTNFQLQSVAASGGSAAGSNTQVQFNSSGALAGSANMTFDGTSLTGTFISTAGSANGVAYLTGTKQLTSASGFTVSGTTWTNTGSFVVGSPTGGDKGAGTINATGLYVNGVAVVSGSGPVSGPASSTDYGLALWNGTSGLSLRSMSGVGTSGQVLTSAGTGAAPTWTTPSAGALTLLATITPTAAANVDFLSTFTSTYDNYLIMVDNIAPASYTSSPSLQIRFANSGVADTASNYISANNSSETTATSTSFQIYQQNTGYGSGFINIFNVNDSTNMKWGNTSFTNNINSSSGAFASLGYIGYIKAASVSGIRFYWSTGANFSATGKIRIYGYSNS
jgi:hypothetical protein